MNFSNPEVNLMKKIYSQNLFSILKLGCLKSTLSFVIFSLLFSLPAQSEIINKKAEVLTHIHNEEFSSSCMVIYRDGLFENGYFQINHPENGLYFIDNQNFIAGDYGRSYPLVNFNLSFLNIKENVIPFIHPFFLIKFLHVVSEHNFNQRITDALRTSENQLRYKKRGWTGTENSPHMVGLAADLGSYGVSDRNSIRELSEILNLRFLEHGKGANRHIHIQDNSVWRNLDTSEVKILSNAFNVDADIDKFCRAASYKKLNDDGIKFSQKFIVEGEGLKTLRIEFTDALGIISATYYAGVFKNNHNEVFVNTAFFPTGVYKAEVFINDIKVSQRILAIN